MDYNNGPPQPGYAPSNVGGPPSPPGPGYAPSQVSAPPPGMGSEVNYNPNNQAFQSHHQHPANQPSCLSRNNPFEKANTVTDDVYFNASYKRMMGLAIVSVISAGVGSLVVTQTGCLYINAAPVLHLIPIFLPSCNRFAVPYYWAIICMASVGLSAVTLFFGLIQGCATEAAIVFAITLVIEGVGMFLLYRMDPTLKDKIKYCFASCGCLGNEAQMQTMVPKETTYTTPNMSPQGPGGPRNFNGYDGNSHVGGLGPGSYVGDRTGGANAFQGPGSVQSGYNSGYSYPPSPQMQPHAHPQPPASPSSVVSGYSNTSGGQQNQSGPRKASGRGGFIIDAPAEYDGGSRVGY